MSVVWDDIEAAGNGGATVPRDRWGRPLIEGKAWTRATTFAGAIADKAGLIPWACEMTARGLATRHDLLAAAASVLDDPKQLRRVANDAKEAGGASASATIGTALHRMTELADLGQPVPDLHADRVAEYRAALDTHGVEILPDWVERLVLVDRFRVAGTPDRIVMWRGQPTVFDLKTGKDLRWAMSEIAVQLALYANADAGWDAGADTRVPFPGEVRKDVALVAWLPAKGTGCELLEVDIAAGWEAATHAEFVRSWRSRKDLSKPVAGAEHPQPHGDISPVVGAVETAPAPPRIIGSVTPLTKAPATVRPRPDEGADVDLADLVTQVKAAVEEWARRVESTPAELQARMKVWRDQATADGNSFQISGTAGRGTARRRRCWGAAVRLAALTVDDADALELLARHVEGVQPAMTVGAVLGAAEINELAAVIGELNAVAVMAAN